jgi:PucR family transcriptional regulator, purine catabolism regulatory protein
LTPLSTTVHNQFILFKNQLHLTKCKIFNYYFLQYGGWYMGKLKITIADILRRDLFQNAKLIAGEGGKNRKVKWTHILEMEIFDSFINGGELILTTGSNLQFDSSAGIDQLKKLIKYEVAGICIELGTHIKTIDPSIIEYANQHQFPIIVFTCIVKFVDITQDLHSIIVNSHHEKLHHLHNLSNEFNQLSLASNGILKIIKKLYDYFGKTIFLITDEEKIYYYPIKCKDIAASTLSKSNDDNQQNSYNHLFINGEVYTIFPIKGLGYSWANLYIQESIENIDDFSFSIIDRATLAIAQILLRNRTIEERKQNQEEILVQQLLQGKEYDTSTALKILPAPAENLYYRLIVIENNLKPKNLKDNEWEEIKLQQSIILRSIFRKHSFFPSISVTKRKIAIIASFYKTSYGNKSDVNLFQKIIKDIKNINEEDIFNGKNLYISVSSLQKDYSQVTNCYVEANEVLRIQRQGILDVVFFDDIGIYRLLTKLNPKDLENYCLHYLEPLLQHDDLLLTLTVYLETMGSKKETSDRLSIVRQTLYHRLDKIEELLGHDFMEPIKRQAIEMAIHAYKLLNKNQKEKSFIEKYNK